MNRIGKGRFRAFRAGNHPKGEVHPLATVLTLLSLHTLHSVSRAFVYLALFGVGSILGMVLFSVAISLPLRFSARHLVWASNGLQAALGVVALLLGGWITVQGAFFGVTRG